jgi:NitT/TauT family transport system permease protein
MVKKMPEATSPPLSADDAEIFAAVAAKQRERAFHETNAGIWTLRLLLTLTLLGVWELSSGPLIEPFWISSPSEIIGRIYEWFTTGEIYPHLQATLTSMVLGFSIGALAGVAFGLFLGSSPLMADVLRPFLVGFYGMPKVALIPLFILWFGVGMQSVVILVALTVFFPVFYNTFSGLREIDRSLLDSVRLFGAGWPFVFLRVALPAARHWIFAGLRISVRYALTTTIYGELVGGSRGIGFLLEYSASRFDTRSVMAAIVILGVCGLLLVAGVARSERAFGSQSARPFA